MRIRMVGWITLGAVGVSLGGFLVAGCGQKDDKAASKPGTTAAANQVPAAVQGKQANPQISPAPAHLLPPFKEAVLFEPPEGEQRPPDRTSAGMNVGALFETIAGQEGAPGLWDKIALSTPEGTALRYTAQVKTDLGTMVIELFGDAAPNHVRNFIALAQAGYYNGLPFHRSLNSQMEGQTLAYLEAGCPLGTGESGLGSIGYWLKPEISPSLTHEDGTIGAVHGESLESAACKFYISLTKAPGMDGGYTIFGKITKGLDIAHAINKRPVIEDGDLEDRPKEPVIIREVTIQSSVSGAAIVARSP